MVLCKSSAHAQGENCGADRDRFHMSAPANEFGEVRYINEAPIFRFQRTFAGDRDTLPQNCGAVGWIERGRLALVSHSASIRWQYDKEGTFLADA